MDLKELYSIKGQLTTDIQIIQAQLQQIDAEILRIRNGAKEETKEAKQAN